MLWRATVVNSLTYRPKGTTCRGAGDGEQAEWPRLVRALAIVDQCLTCKARLAYHLGK
jgi:hypothetical protein